jgi:predicted CxxxxCH...CXXCH cytochrome family protein
MGRLLPWLGVLLLASCERRPLADGLPAKLNCSACHGVQGNSAPPCAVNGATSTTDMAVGAHQSHLKAGRLSSLVACEECHVFPSVMDGDEHPNPLGGPAKMTFGPLAQTQGAKPTWNRDTATCTNTYCHGSSLRDASSRPAPRWTKVDGTQIKCDSCHGNPPGGDHSTSKKCEACHGEVVDPGSVIKNKDLHINGTVETL